MCSLTTECTDVLRTEKFFKDLRELRGEIGQTHTIIHSRDSAHAQQ